VNPPGALIVMLVYCQDEPGRTVPRRPPAAPRGEFTGLMMAKIPLRLLGLFLLTLAIAIPSCQAVFARAASGTQAPLSHWMASD
jgi:hypothetical protein